FCPDSRGQSVNAVVCSFDNFFYILELLHGKDRTKNFLTDDLHIPCNVGNNCRTDKRARRTSSLTTGYDGGALTRGHVNEASYPFRLTCRYKWTHLDRPVQTVPHCHPLSICGKPLNNTVVNRAVNIRPRASDTDLSGIEENRIRRPRYGIIKIRITHQNNRRLS